MQSLLLDTCIWLDDFDISRPHGDVSRKLISLCFSREIPLLYSVCALQNIEYLSQHFLKKSYRDESLTLSEASARAIQAAALAYLDNMSEIATAVGADQADAWLARKLATTHGDFEDCLVLAAMERSGAAFLVTSDKQLIKHSPYPTLTPEDMLAYLEENPMWGLMP